MSKPDSTESKKEIGNLVQHFVYRLPRKNHDVMMRNMNQLTEMFKKHGMLRSEVFQLTNSETLEGFTSITNTISANSDEEVWMELHSYRDRKHIEEVLKRIQNDERDGLLFQQFTVLITPGSSCIMGEFSRISG